MIHQHQFRSLHCTFSDSAMTVVVVLAVAVTTVVVIAIIATAVTTVIVIEVVVTVDYDSNRYSSYNSICYGSCNSSRSYSCSSATTVAVAFHMILHQCRLSRYNNNAIHSYIFMILHQ